MKGKKKKGVAEKRTCVCWEGRRKEGREGDEETHVKILELRNVPKGESTAAELGTGSLSLSLNGTERCKTSKTRKANQIHPVLVCTTNTHKQITI